MMQRATAVPEMDHTISLSTGTEFSFTDLRQLPPASGIVGSSIAARRQRLKKKER